VERPGIVSLVGAGPGDPELITVKGRERLARADLVLYDALAHPELLDLCRPGAERVFVGKRAGRRSERQQAINDRMVAAAREGRHVVRLKGGDPYLFGRGSEEAEVLADAGIPFEVVPGVPSPLAATAYAGLSLTHRDLASSVAYLTATESPQKDRSAHVWAKLATATQTLVIFMGMRKLETLMSLLVEHGRDPSTPAAVVQWASLPKQRTVVGTVETIASLAQDAGLGLPSLIVVGDVVRLRKHLRWFDSKPLFGKRALVLRAKHQAASLAEPLRDAGAVPVLAPTLRLLPPDDLSALDAAALALGGYDWVLLTSRNAADALFAALARTAGDARRFGTAKVLAIGSATERALADRGIRADLVPSSSRAEGVLEALAAELEGSRARILLPRAEVAREVLPEGLRDGGHLVDVVVAYRNVGPDDAMRAELTEATASADAVLVTSGSSIDQLVDAVGIDALSGKVLASIGSVTSEAIRAHGLEVHAEAATPGMAALVDALAAYYAER